MARGRKAIPVNAQELQSTVSNLESQTMFPNRSALWAAVAASDWAKSIGLSSQVAMLKAQAFGTVINTAKGKRGREKGQGPANTSKPKGRRRIPLDVVPLLKKVYHPSLHGKVDRAAAGSLKAAIALKCIDCCGGIKSEVRECQIQECVLWAFRPYR
jgi:hypothetical protein